MARPFALMPCQCDDCARDNHVGDRIALWVGIVAFALLPARAIVALAMELVQ